MITVMIVVCAVVLSADLLQLLAWWLGSQS
jgi:hypothetical protein